jgi:hypothetical protein
MSSPLYTCFEGARRVAAGPLDAIALQVKRAQEGGAAGPFLIFDDATGRSIDIDTRGSDHEVLSRVAAPRAEEAQAEPERRGRGRPRLGVVAREVTLLPRHWAWLNAQPGGASVALRKLVEQARRTHGEKDRRRNAQERAYYFMSAMAGNLPGFEEAARALFVDDEWRVRELTAAWPQDVREHALALAFGDAAGDD